MNDLQQDPDLSLEERARISNAKERSDYVASQQLQAWKELAKSEAFKVPMQRIREKREARERSVIEGVALDKYPIIIAEIALLKELEAMPAVERANCFKELNPNAGAEPRD